MLLKHSAVAGFEEKNDALVEVIPGASGSGIVVNLKSSVMRQYGKHLQQVITQTAQEAGFTDVIINVIDKGAWDYTIKARVEGALERGVTEC